MTPEERAHAVLSRWVEIGWSASRLAEATACIAELIRQSEERAERAEAALSVATAEHDILAGDCGRWKALARQLAEVLVGFVPDADGIGNGGWFAARCALTAAREAGLLKAEQKHASQEGRGHD